MMAASFAPGAVWSITAAALATALGADIGTSLVAQLYSFRPPALSPILIPVGVVMFADQRGDAPARPRAGHHRPGLALTALQTIAAKRRASARSSSVLVDIADRAGRHLL